MAQEFKEKTITINLRRVFMKPTTKRATAALYAVKEAVKKETRKTDISISQGVNLLIWERGLYNCPRRMTVKIVADEKDKAACRVYLPDEKIVEKKEKAGDKKAEKKGEAKKEDKKAETKAEEKKENKKAEEKPKAAPAAKASEAKKEVKAPETKKEEKKAAPTKK